MSNAHFKTPLQVALGNVAKTGAKDAISLLGSNLPASIVSINGSIATVKFEVLSDYNLPHITVPVLTSQYVREPLQQGDMGILIACDASISAISGMGQNKANLSQPANLSALAFLPIGNKNWKSVDPNMLVLTGLNDVMIRDNTHQVQLEDLNTAFTSLIADINNRLSIIGPLLTTPTTLVPIPSTDNPVKPRA